MLQKGSETTNHLIPTSFEPASDYAIEISSELLETSLLEPCKKESHFTYPKQFIMCNIRFHQNK
jgi:hypothetical protein